MNHPMKLLMICGNPKWTNDLNSFLDKKLVRASPMVQISKWKVIFVLVICAFGIILASPNIISPERVATIPSWLPKKQMNLGLDLRGGAHLLIEAKVEEALKEGLENLQQGVRSALRKSPNIGYRNHY